MVGDEPIAPGQIENSITESTTRKRKDSGKLSENKLTDKSEGNVELVSEDVSEIDLNDKDKVKLQKLDSKEEPEISCPLSEQEEASSSVLSEGEQLIDSKSNEASTEEIAVKFEEPLENFSSKVS